MDIKNIARDYVTDLKKAADQIDVDQVQQIADIFIEAYKNDRTIFILGNGGSASTASHMSCDFGKNTLQNVYDPKNKRIKVISLTDNVALMTAFSNDLTYEDVFAEQLLNLVKPKDVVVAISGSGNSPNVLKALNYAKDHQAITVGFLGFHTGGKAKELCDYDITIQSDSYGVVEDLHLMLNHLFTTCLTYMKEHTDNQKP